MKVAGGCIAIILFFCLVWAFQTAVIALVLAGLWFLFGVLIGGAAMFPWWYFALAGALLGFITSLFTRSKSS